MSIRCAPALLLLTLALSGCEKAVVCDDKGEILIPADASIDVRQRDVGRNLRLETRRLDHLMGETPFADPATLSKAEGCP